MEALEISVCRVLQGFRRKSTTVDTYVLFIMYRPRTEVDSCRKPLEPLLAETPSIMVMVGTSTANGHRTNEQGYKTESTTHQQHGSGSFLN